MVDQNLQYYTTYLEMIIEQNPKDERVGDWEERLKEVKKSDPVTATVAGGHKLFGKPSTGMSMLYALKDLCSSVSLYGCGTHDAEGKPGEYKYYQPGETHTVSGNVKVRSRLVCPLKHCVCGCIRPGYAYHEANDLTLFFIF